MKSVLVFALALCSLASAFPRAVKEEDSQEDVAPDTEYVRVPVMRSNRPSFGFGLPSDLAPPPVGQDSFLFRLSPWGRPAAPGDQEQVDDFMTQMQTMLTEMRRQITEMLHHSHNAGAGLPGDENNTGVGTRIGEGELPQNKSTSTTKVIDGHVVTVNETTYSSGDDNIGAVFRIKVVEVVPSETPEGEGEVDTASKAEPTTSKSELDADKGDETNEIPSQKVSSEWDAEIDPSFNEINQDEDFSAEIWSPNKKENYYDLRDDTNVNHHVSDQFQSQGLVMIEPDAEVFDSDLNSYYHYESVPQRLQRFP